MRKLMHVVNCCCYSDWDVGERSKHMFRWWTVGGSRWHVRRYAASSLSSSQTIQYNTLGYARICNFLALFLSQKSQDSEVVFCCSFCPVILGKWFWINLLMTLMLVSLIAVLLKLGSVTRYWSASDCTEPLNDIQNKFLFIFLIKYFWCQLT